MDFQRIKGIDFTGKIFSAQFAALLFFMQKQRQQKIKAKEQKIIPGTVRDAFNPFSIRNQNTIKLIINKNRKPSDIRCRPVVRSFEKIIHSDKKKGRVQKG